MSEAVSALNGAGFDGLAQVREIGLQGMITLRGDLSAKPVRDAATAATGAAMPEVTSATFSGDKGLAWMSPDELLVLCPYGEAEALAAQVRDKLGDTHSLAVNVSDARAVFEVSGPSARDVMAKLSPVDLSPGAFEPGQFRRTRMAQVSAAFWMPEADTFRIVCFRSAADYVFGLLKAAAAPGSGVF